MVVDQSSWKRYFFRDMMREICGNGYIKLEKIGGKDFFVQEKQKTSPR